MSSQGTRGSDAASAVVWFVGISQGLVPLVVAGVFERESRIALPLLLPDPWWWIACLAVLALAVVALVAIDDRAERAVPDAGGGAPAADEESAGAAGYDPLSGLVLLVGIYNGLAPFVARLVFGGDLFLAFTLRLPFAVVVAGLARRRRRRRRRGAAGVDRPGEEAGHGVGVVR